MSTINRPSYSQYQQYRFISPQKSSIQPSAPNSVEPKYKKASIGRMILSAAIVDAAFELGYRGYKHLLQKGYSKVRIKHAPTISDDQLRAVKQFGVEALKGEGLESAGCKINFLSDKTKLLANFNIFSKDIAISPHRTMYMSIFHELGHAKNNLSKVLRPLQYSRLALPYLSSPVMLISLLQPKRAPEDKPEGFWQKSGDFIKKNAVALSAAGFAPVLIEEGLATANGLKLAEKYVKDTDLIKKADIINHIKKVSRAGFATYLSKAAVVPLLVFAGLKIHDAITAPKLIEPTSKQA